MLPPQISDMRPQPKGTFSAAQASRINQGFSPGGRVGSADWQARGPRATTSWPASDRRAARSPSGCRSKSETQSHNADLGGNEPPRALSEGRGSTEAESPGKQFRPKQVHRSASLQLHLRPTLWSGPSNSGTRLPETSSP